MHEQGAMWSGLVSIYMYSYDPKKGRLTFSNTSGRRLIKYI